MNMDNELSLKGIGELSELQLAAMAYRAKNDLKYFTSLCWNVLEPKTPFIDNWHIDAICEHLEATVKGEILNLIINIPPRYMKTTVVSQIFTPWVWIKYPHLRFLNGSYSKLLSARDTAKALQIIKSKMYQGLFGNLYRIKHGSAMKIENSMQGTRLSVSVGSSTTGEGGNFVMCDDPHNITQIESPAVRASAIRWWMKTMSTRMNNPKTSHKIMVCQRASAADLSSAILETDDYTKLILPAEYRPTTYVSEIGWSDPRKEEGELLWPAMQDQAFLDKQKVTLGPIDYACQYLQDPVQREGAAIKSENIQHYCNNDDGTITLYDKDTTNTSDPISKRTLQEKDCRYLAFVDLAIGTKSNNDYTAIVVVKITSSKDILVEFVYRARVEDSVKVKVIKALMEEYPLSWIGVEAWAYQKSFVELLKREGVNAKEYRVGDKRGRLAMVSSSYDLKRIYHNQNGSWLHKFEKEILEANVELRHAHDDQIDALSLALNFYNQATRRQQSKGISVEIIGRKNRRGAIVNV